MSTIWALLFTLLFVAIALGALAVFVWRAQPTNPVNIWFAAYSALVSIWTAAIAGVHTDVYPELSGRLAFTSASLVPAAFLAFTHHYPDTSRGPSLSILRGVFLVGFALASLSVVSRYIAYDFSIASGELTRAPGPLYPVFVAYFVTAWTTAAAFLIYKWRCASGATRAQLRYVAAGLITASGLAIITNLLVPLLTGRSTYTWLGPIFSLVFVGMTAHAIIRHHAMDLKLVIHRGLTFAIAMLISAGPVAAFALAVWPQLPTHLRRDELVSVLGALVIVSLLTPMTRDFVNRLLNKYLFRFRVNYQETLRNASRALTRLLDLRLIASFVIESVTAPTGCEGAAVYLRNGDRFHRLMFKLQHAIGRFEAPDFLPDPLVRPLLERRDILTRDQFAASTEGNTALRALSALNWAVVLPMLSEDSVIGAIAVGSKLSGDPLYRQDLDLLMTLANQAGTATKNGQLYLQVVLANEYIENIVSTIESGVIAIDATGNVAMFNRTAEQLTGLEMERVHEQPVSVLPTDLTSLLKRTLADGQRRTQADIDLTAGGVTRPVLCTTSPLRDPVGTVLGAVAVFSDLTPLKELEDQRRRAERLAYFEVLASSLAHEIKNPLVAIKTFSQLLPRRRDDDRFVDEFSRTVTREIERMERLLTRLRTLSRPSDRPKQPIDLRTPIREAIEFMQPAFDEKRVALRANLGSEPSTILGDHGQLEELFLNLLMNAREATPPEGAVTVDLLAIGGSASVFVADSGPGIAADVIDKIFDPFFTTKQGGSGLGLAICSGIATSHRANLRAANGPAGGAVFIFELSLASPVTAAARR